MDDRDRLIVLATSLMWEYCGKEYLLATMFTSFRSALEIRYTFKAPWYYLPIVTTAVVNVLISIFIISSNLYIFLIYYGSS